MSYTVTQEENYSIIKLEKDALATAKTDALKSECMKLIKANPFIIMNCKELASINTDQKNLLVSLNHLAKRASGSIILTELHDDMIAAMEKAELDCVPTDEEAVDFIFIAQMENQFADENEDDEDDF